MFIAIVGKVIAALFKRNAGIGDQPHSGACDSTKISMAMNPIASISADPYHALYLLQIVSQYELGVAKESLACEIALRVAADKEPSIIDLVAAWKAEPTLHDFADAVSRVMLHN